MSSLTVRYQGAETVVRSDEGLSFGREADLIIDSNPYLHRCLGLLSRVEGVWVLANVGSTLSMRVCSSSLAVTDLAPGSSSALTDSAYVVTFSVGRIDYELEIESTEHPQIPVAPEDLAGSETREWGVIPLNFEQRRLLVALSESRLRGEPSVALPSNKEVMARLGLRRKQFDSRLDHLCRRFSEAGVPGLSGDRGGEAHDRRHRLVDHVVNHRIVTVDDLALLS